MFKGLTQRAQRILTVIAQDEARRFHSDQLLPEHVLVAMFKDGSGVACKALEDLAIDLQEFRHVLERELAQKGGTFIFGDVPPSRRARLLLETDARRGDDAGQRRDEGLSEGRR
ncbi:MAG: Clp protease N-terminal domain-containing protein, partial [Termitinemataceae bacterium]